MWRGTGRCAVRRWRLGWPGGAQLAVVSAWGRRFASRGGRPLSPPPSVSLELPRRERLPPRGDRGQAKGCGDPPTNPCRPYVGTPQGHENEAQRRQRRALQLHAAARPGAPPATSRHPSWGAAAAVASGMKTSLRLSTPGDPFCPVNEWFLEPYVVPQRPLQRRPTTGEGMSQRGKEGARTRGAAKGMSESGRRG